MADATDNRIRVLELSTKLCLGGIEALIARLVPAIDASSFDMSACSIDELGCFGERLAELGFNVHHLAKRPGIPPSAWLKLAGILRRERIDVLHAHNFQALFWGLPAARLAGVSATVYTVHGNIFRTSRRIVLAERFLARFATRITAVSESSRRDLDDAGVSTPDKVQVIPNGIDPSRFNAPVDRVSERAALGLPSEGPVLGTCSRLVQGKGIEHVIQALPAVLERIENASVLIVGDGPMREELGRQAEALGVGGRVVFAGFREDVAAAMALMDVFVLASASEGLSLALLEAMAASLPVVVTAVGDNPLVVLDGETGRLIAPDAVEPEYQGDGALSNVLIETLSDEENLHDMGRRARERVTEHYSQQKMVEAYQRLFEELAS